MIFAIENSDMKNAIHLFEINIQFKKKIKKKPHKLDRKKIKMGEKEMREKYEKRKKISSLIVTCIKLLLFRILRRE